VIGIESEKSYLRRKKKCDEFYTNVKNGSFGMILIHTETEKNMRRNNDNETN